MERREDARGFFARSWCVNEFAAHGLNTRLVQCNCRSTPHKGTLRGMHLSGCALRGSETGALHDGRDLGCGIIDLRPASPTFCQHVGVELTAENRRALYIPEGFAHGFQTLADDTEVFYQMSEFYHPECARGVRWNDPAFGIAWPLPDPVLSERDMQFADFQPSRG